MTSDVAQLLSTHANAVEAYLRDRLPKTGGFNDAPKAVIEAINYSLLAGGKRLRPALVIECAQCCGGKDAATRALPAAAAVELIHTFSLVHDDLPAMDDDDLRRGRPTSHKVYGEALAILAGDAMTSLAFETLADEYEPPVAAALVKLLARATGPVGMIGGQTLDIAAENQKLSLEELQNVHRRKTGALLTAACEMGAIVAGASDAQRDALRRYGQHLGLAFQIADDVLDVTATSEATGKATHKDAAAGKNTYPSLLGLDEARRLANDEASAAVAALASFDASAEGLRLLATFAASRSH